MQLPSATELADDTPDNADITRETYLGSTKRVNVGGTENYTSGDKSFQLPENQGTDTFALSGAWKLDTQSITPTGDSGQIKLDYRAKEVRMVLSGKGTVTVQNNGQTKTIEVDGTPNSYQLLATQQIQGGSLTATVGPGVQAFSFTFG